MSETGLALPPLERAREAGIRVRPLAGELWQATSSEPALRGPYLVTLLDDQDGGCECEGGRYQEFCWHRAAVQAAAGGDVSWLGTETDFAAAQPPAADPASGYVSQPPRPVVRTLAAYEVAVGERLAAAAPIEARDYATLFPD